MGPQKIRKLGTRNTILLGLSFMAPALSLLATFSLVMTAGYTWAGVPLAYFAAGLAVIVTATSFADLSRTHPGGGSVHNYSRKIIGPRLGQMPVWIYMLELLVIPAAALVPVGFFVQDWFGLSPWITVLISFIIVMVLSNAGINLSFKTLAILFGIQIAILLIFAVSAIIWSIQGGLFGSMSVTALSPSGSLMGWAGIIVGAAAAVYSFLGFESSSAMSDETENPGKTIPKSILITAVIGTIINTFMAWVFVLAIPTKGLFSLLYYLNPVPAMAGELWRSIPPFYADWRHLLNMAGTVAGLTGALASVTATSRILEQLGKDRVLPKIFSRLSNKRQTPSFSIGFIGAISLLVAMFVPWESIAMLIATGAVPTFFLVNLMSFLQHRSRQKSLVPVFRHWLLPWIGMIMCAWIIAVGLPVNMKLILLLWIMAGFVIVCARELIQKKDPRFSRRNWIGTVLSLAGLSVSVVIFLTWSRFTGSLEWWHIKAPYAQGNVPATVIAIVVAVLFAASPVWLLFRERPQKGGKTQ